MANIRVDIDHGELSDSDAEHFSQLANRCVDAAVKHAHLLYPNQAELSILLADDQRLRDLNHEWRSIDKATNVLSFPGQDIRIGEMAGQVLGDIAISMDAVSREACLENKTEDDHFCHLIVHGFLHLFGYDHETDDDAESMETYERVILAELGIADPYESGSYP